MHKHMADMTTTVQHEWPWKVEPISPPPLSDLDTDNWFTASTGEYLLADTNCDSNLIIIPDPVDEVDVDSKPLTRAETATRLLNDLNEWIKEEPFSDWYEEKIDLPIIFEDLETVPLPAPRKDAPTVYDNKEYIDVCNYDNRAVHPVDGKVHMPASNIVILPESQPRPQHLPVQPSEPLVPVIQLGEQTSVLMQEFDFVLNNNETLTPPESPRDDNINLTMLQDMRTEELDELVRIRVESLVEGPDNSCSSSLHEDSSADSPASSDSGYDDPDWTPPPVVLELKQGKRRRSTKPYSRPPPEEKRQRKKEQNKNAATRYRQKKKAEVEEILGEEKGLEDKNLKLKADVSELAREIKYLKNLMREVFKAKGLIK